MFRSRTVRLSYLGQDRADMQEATKCLPQKMKVPIEYDMGQLRSVARYLMKVPRAVLRSPEQSQPKELEAWVDADVAGARSTSGLVMLFGKHQRPIQSMNQLDFPQARVNDTPEWREWPRFSACVR